MQNGRIEPLRALPFMGGTALPTATLVGQSYTVYIDFPLDGNTLNPAAPALQRGTPQNLRLLQGPLALAGSPQLLTSPARGLPWRRLEPCLQQKREDDLFEVGIEGVALNPNRM